jgi:hypothetical protein
MAVPPAFKVQQMLLDGGMGPSEIILTSVSSAEAEK